MTPQDLKSTHIKNLSCTATSQPYFVPNVISLSTDTELQSKDVKKQSRIGNKLCLEKGKEVCLNVNKIHQEIQEFINSTLIQGLCIQIKATQTIRIKKTFKQRCNYLNICLGNKRKKLTG